MKKRKKRRRIPMHELRCYACGCMFDAEDVVRCVISNHKDVDTGEVYGSYLEIWHEACIAKWNTAADMIDLAVKAGSDDDDATDRDE